MDCADCKYGHYVGYALLCWGKKNAPEVAPYHWCEDWKTRTKPEKVTWIPASVQKPAPFVSVLAYIPDQAPFPTVREAYYVDNKTLWPFIPHWQVPSLDGLSNEIHNVTHWAEMPDGPEDLLCSIE